METFDYDKMWQEEMPFAKRLAEWIKFWLNPEFVVDLGCGPGMYVHALNEIDVEAVGYDTDERIKDKQNLYQQSIFDLDSISGIANVALCIEVAEHIKEKLSRQIVKSCLGILERRGILIWSAAIPGQGGVGHINCQPKEYWHNIFRACGAIRLHELEEDMLSSIRRGYHMGWFTQNAMIFMKI
jgi:hypothetical protein